MTTLTPYPSLPPNVFLSPFSPESLGHTLNPAGVVAAPTSTTYATANSVWYYPLTLNTRALVKRFFWCNGTTAGTNNLQVGVYSNTGSSIVRGTSTLASGVSQPQFDNITDFELPAGKYYMAIWCNGTTTHVLRYSPTYRFLRPCGVFQQTGQTGGLPATATFATLTTSTVYVFGLALRASP